MVWMMMMMVKRGNVSIRAVSNGIHSSVQWTLRSPVWHQLCPKMCQCATNVYPHYCNVLQPLCCTLWNMHCVLHAMSTCLTTTMSYNVPLRNCAMCNICTISTCFTTTTCKCATVRCATSNFQLPDYSNVLQPLCCTVCNTHYAILTGLPVTMS